MSTWKVNVRGEQHTVRFDSPTFGRKVIYIDGQELKKVGLMTSMWSSYHFDVHGEPATVKFRAIKRMKGMSLYMNGEKVEPEPGAEMSAEALSMLMIGVLVFIVGVFIFAAARGR